MRQVQRTRHDPLAALVDLPGVAAAMESAREAIDALLWDRRVRAAAVDVVRRSVELGASASAALEGADLSVVEESPMGRTLLAAQAVTEQAQRESRTWERAPLQVLATLHAVVVRALGAQSHPGMPRAPRDVAEAGVDPLRIGGLPPAEAVAARLQELARVLAMPTQAPGLVVAAVVHGELMAVRPFAVGSGLVARAAVRCVLATRGVDPSNFGIPEEGMLALGRPTYVRAIQDFATGTPDRMAQALVAFAGACEGGALAARAAP